MQVDCDLYKSFTKSKIVAASAAFSPPALAPKAPPVCAANCEGCWRLNSPWIVRLVANDITHAARARVIDT
jgi:hypothetical protein